MTEKQFNQCLERYRQEDREGLEEIYKKFRSTVYYSALEIVKNEPMAEDVTSTVFVNIALHAIRNSDYIESPKAWISQVTRNTALKLISKERQNDREELSEELVADVSQSDNREL